MQLLLPKFRHLQNEHGQALYVPETTYEVLKEDFEIAKHFATLNTFNFKKVSGIYIQASNRTDGVLAAIYAYKYYVAQNQDYFSCEGDSYVSKALEEDDPLVTTWGDGTYQQLPVVEYYEFVSYYQPEPIHRKGRFAQKVETDEHAPPYWLYLSTPLIIYMKQINLDMLTNALEQQNRFVIFVEIENENTLQMMPFGSFNANKEEDALPNHLKSFLFETNVEFVQVPQSEMSYLVSLFKHLVTAEGYTLTQDVNCTQIIELLQNYRKDKFKGGIDIQSLIQKAIRYTDGSCIDSQALKRFFLNQDIELLKKPIQQSNAYQKLNELIGLKKVKNQLIRLIERMKFTARRKQANLPNMDHHLAAVFAGEPGTCKTTVARLFGQLLLEANVLSNNVFLEISRKDLIGKYVGWTAPKVQEVFDKAKGGTVFIDEAYSLSPQHHKDSFSEEAIATIIQCMENHPDTLVIFAGYTNEMRNFIQHANPGLRSRLTNIIVFNDYSIEELIEIFYYQVKQGGYKVQNKKEINSILQPFLEKMLAFPSTQQGNGRLIRKLVSTAVSYMAMRNPKNLTVLKSTDIAASCEELLQAELLLHTQQTQIGFHPLSL